ncbi:MAG: NDP-sugar synthase [Dehalococcoidia bacterium]|nr:NDP-sugar synthase [Dehalococcoidia bacterium]
MKSIILVGGEGTRLRPLTYSVVKSMVPVVNRPFIEHVISRLAQHNVHEIVLAMGYKPDSVFEYFKDVDESYVKLTYSLEEQPLGTAGAVKFAGQHVDETFFVLNGDVFTDIDYSAMLSFHRQNKARVTIALTHVDDPTKFGVVETTEDGRVIRFTEKPKWEEVRSHWINAGIYILEPEVLDYIPENIFYMFEKGVFPGMLEKGEPVYAYNSESYWIDMGTPAKYHQLNVDILSGICTSPLHKAEPVITEARTTLAAKANVTGPVMTGAGCIIEENVKLEGPVILGDHCHIKRGARIMNSILWDDITVGEESSIINSIIASGDNIKNRTSIEGLTINHEAPAESGGK